MTRRGKNRATAPLDAVADVARQLAALPSMTVAELTVRYRDVFGEPTRSRNKDYLRKKVAWRIQELAEGGLSDAAKAKIEELASDAPVRWQKPQKARAASKATSAAPDPGDRDPRLPPVGTELTRTHQGDEHRVLILADGFEYAGTRHKSLSAIAREITGTAWNGFLFFGLADRRRKPTPGGK
jgi:hypothetical protein